MKSLRLKKNLGKGPFQGLTVKQSIVPFKACNRLQMISWEECNRFPVGIAKNVIVCRLG